MAIAGLLVHTLSEHIKTVEAQIKKMPEMTSHGIHQNQYVVVVAEAPSDQLEKKADRIKKIEGVLAIYTTYVTIEDELDGSAHSFEEDPGDFDDSADDDEYADEDEG